MSVVLAHFKFHIQRKKSIYDSYTGFFNNINCKLNTQRLESINIYLSSAFKESWWIESQNERG